ncbi:MAG: rane protein involved in aromatic hydrocarbon degradation [Ramlibacter sp.]|nr:rane protein involved in aromatic hydrocarbon degradation [Ramlibacter sp.]
MVRQSFAVRSAVRATGLATLVIAGLAEPAGATGFFVNQQSVKGLGRVGAGDAAVADELGTIYFNPAGLTEIWGDGLSKNRVALGGHLIVPHSDRRNAGSTAATPGTLGTPAPYAGGDLGNAVDPAFIPNFYWARELVPGRAAIGAGVNFPFGLSTAFPGDWFGRYDAIEASLRTVNLTAVGAYRFDSGVSIGGGLDFQYAHSRLLSAIPNPLTPGGPTAATDGRAETKGQDWTPGFNLGILVPLTGQTRIGVHYRSGMKHTLEGSTQVSGLTGPLAPFNGSVGAKGDLHLPAIGTVAVRHSFSPDLQLLASLEWFDWSRFRELRIKFSDGSPDVVRTSNYRDAFALALGAEYRVSNQLSARGGIRFDQTPTVNGFRDTTVPDAERLWLGVGATYRPGKESALDFAYNHVFFRNADIAVTRTFFDGSPLASTVNVTGRAKSSVNNLSVGYRHAF